MRSLLSYMASSNNYYSVGTTEDITPTDPLLQAEQGDGLPIQEDTRRNSWWSRLTFGWVTPLLDVGANRSLVQDDLFPLPSEMSPSSCCSKLYSKWQDERKRGSSHPSLLRAVFFTYGWEYVSVGMIKVINDSLSFAGPVFLNKIVAFVESGNSSLQYGCWCAVGLGAVSVIRALLGAQYAFLLSKLRLQLRASITTVVYQKALSVSMAERSCFSSGEIQTLMSVDAERVANVCASGHELWSLPFQMAVALWMLYTQVKFAFMAGLGVIIMLIPINRWIALTISAANVLMMNEKDERVQRMGELLSHIRTLKMYTWEQLFFDRVMQSRKRELKHLATRKYLDAFCVYFWACTPTLFSLFTFGLYVLLGHTLNAATVFTSLALFNILMQPLNSFPWVINGMIEAGVSLQRLCKFLTCEEVDGEWMKEMGDWTYGLSVSSSNLHTSIYNDRFSRMAVSVQNAGFCWAHSKEQNLFPIISQISLQIPSGSLVVLTGKVGCGKSSLLEAILGEMRCVEGLISVSGSLAFVSQVPWIQSGTFCDNILFGQPYDADRYKKVVDACALGVDMQQLQGGNLAEIVEQGSNLSGGQRARLALARALYRDCEIYLLDDPLSSVDAHVAAWILEHAIHGPLMSSKTRILCTHHKQAIATADLVVVMDEGRIIYSGCPGNLESSVSYEKYIPLPNKKGDLTVLSSLANLSDMSWPQEVLQTDDLLDDSAREITSHNHVDGSIIPDQNLMEKKQKPVKLVEEEERRTGKVQAKVYWAYASFVGWPLVAVILLSTSLMQATRNGSDWWLAYWVDTTLDGGGDHSLHFYLKVYVGFAVANSLFTLARAFSFAYGGMCAAFQVHKSLLQRIFTAPIAFFDQNPRGRVLNRFSSDQYTVDDSLPFIVNILLANSFSFLGIIVVLCYVQWIFILSLVPVGFIFIYLQTYYRSTSRDLRRLDGVSRSPVYSSFTEALDGASTIRAFKAQAQFATKNHGLVATNLQASYSEISASLWLSTRLQMLAAYVVFSITILVIVSHETGSQVKAVSAGLVGLGLSYASPLISLLSSLLTEFTETEKEMVSMERIQDYMGLEAESCDGSEAVNPSWPSRGEILFHEVTLMYMPTLPPALSKLSFTIQPGEQVGIAGRTGAGKSSILNALFNLTPLSSGTIYIDGVNIAKVSLHTLRGSLSVVPQSPMLFKGTLRENLYPMGNISDEELWNVLEKCHMKEAITKAGGLDLHISECGESLSLGQRQLLCLSRTLLGRARVLCLDECTANIDPHTTRMLQDTVAKECQNVTVITIAHRVSTIIGLDRVIIIDRGSVIEDGKPKFLLMNASSKLSGLVRAAG